MPTEARVTCGDVTLKLTLSEKLLARPFADAVLSPFLKAYGKKTGVAVAVDDVNAVLVDGNRVDDAVLSVAHDVVLLASKVRAGTPLPVPVHVHARACARAHVHTCIRLTHACALPACRSLASSSASTRPPRR